MDKTTKQLINAAHKGDLDKIQKLIDGGANVNGCDSTNNGWTPLFAAVSQRHIRTHLLSFLSFVLFFVYLSKII